jgi:hypothetical protein
MNMFFRYASRLIAVGAFILIVPTLVFASDRDRASGFKLAMGPMSAAQKNQGSPAAEAAPAEPHLGPTYRPRHHHSHHRPWHRHAHHVRSDH